MISIVFLIIGISILCIFAFVYKSEKNFVSGAVPITGVVVDFSLSHSSDNIDYYPVIEFLDQNNHPHKITGSVGSNPPAYKRNDKVNLLYLPETPEKAKVEGFFHLWLGSLITFILGIVFSGIGLLLFSFSSKLKWGDISSSYQPLE